MKSWVLALALVGLPAAGHEGPTPNRVDVSPTLSTSGQPTRAFLETLKEQGYEAVVYLAPPTVGDAIADEPKIVGRQGVLYVNIPIACGGASSMVFLHRVITLKEPPERAWEAVQRAWVPNATWKAYILATLRANGLAYEPL